MRITKKALSIILAIMMVASMMVVGAVSASAETVEVSTADAFLAAVADEAFIKLTDDIDFGRIANYNPAVTVDSIWVRVDLNGHTIQGEFGWGAVFNVKNGGTLTILDNSTAKTGAIIANRAAGSTYAVQVFTDSELNVMSGTLQGYSAGVMLNEDNAVVNISGGTVRAQSGTGNSAVAFNTSASGTSTLNVTGGHLIGAGNCIYTTNSGTTNITISGGELESANNKAVIAICGNDDIDIIGGTFSGGYIMESKLSYPTSTVDISGGDFTECDKVVKCGNYSNTLQYLDDKISVSGGSFSQNITQPVSDGGYSIQLEIDPAAEFVVDFETGATSVVAVAKVGDLEFGTFEAALSAAPAGATVTLINDIDYSKIYTVRNARDSGNGHVVDLKDCTLDLNGHTISTINATVTFAGDGATIKNGTFDLVHKNTDGSYKAGSYAIIIDNAVAGYPATAKVTVTDVVCGGAVNVCGATVELNNVTATTTATKFYTVWAEQNADVTINSGTYTDNQSGGKGIFNTGKGAEGGAAIAVNGGTFETTNKVVYGAESNESINIAGGTFNKEVPVQYCAEDFYPVADGSGNYTVDNITAPTVVSNTAIGSTFGLGNIDFTTGKILGVQLKSYDDKTDTSESNQENGNDIRFVGVIDKELLDAAEDYGFVLAKADATKNSEDRTCANTEFGNMKYNGTNGEKTLSAKNTYNTLGGETYGDPTTASEYKYVTCAVNSVEDGKKIVARFYVKVNGKVYYMDYTNGTGTYSGCVAGMSDFTA